MLTLASSDVQERLCLPLPSLDRGNWRLDRLREFLSEQGYEGLPMDPRGMEGYRKFLEGKGYAPNSVASALLPVRFAYRLANMGDIAKLIIKAPRRPMMHLKDAVPEGDTLKLFHWVDEHLTLKERVIIRLMAYLGLREIEISRLDVGDFFQEDEAWKLRIWGKNRPGKDAKLKVQNGLLTVILELQESLKDQQVGSPMFSGQRGRMHPATISQMVTAIMRAAGVKREDNDHRITPHSLRHTAITKVLKESGDIRLAQLFGRHTDVRVTETYAHDVLQDFGQFNNWEG